MFNLTVKQKKTAGDLAIALGILVLAFLLKDADSEAKTSGMITVAVAILIRFNGLNRNNCSSKNNVNK